MNYQFEDFVNFIKKINYKFVTVVNNNFLIVPNENN